MKTKGPKADFRVVVWPRRIGDLGGVRISDHLAAGGAENVAREYEERCEEMVRDIRRHVENVGTVEVAFSQDDLCSYCGRKWTEDDEQYNGGCCEADEEHAPAENAE